jgi:osmotically-inducible protein OsmY
MGVFEWWLCDEVYTAGMALRCFVRRCMTAIRAAFLGPFGGAQTVAHRRRKIKAPQHTGTHTMKTDSQLQQDVMAELKWEPAVHAAQIGVEVKNGVVTLAGEVGSYSEKLHAEQAAQRVSGVKALVVEMKIKLTEFGKRSDADIAASAKNILAWTSSVPADTVKVMVENGWVTLTGDMAWQFQRQDAADSVRHLVGVTGVSNLITIKPSASASATLVKSDIEAALKRRAAADAKTITVEVSGGDVTLSGTVHSWSERDLATRSAWSSQGVRKVVDKMNLVF